MDSEIRTFHDDDEAYEEWVRSNSGYVLTERPRGEHMLHHSECTHLTGDGTIRLTRRPRRCAKSRQALVAWAVEVTGRPPLRCQSCM